MSLKNEHDIIDEEKLNCNHSYHPMSRLVGFVFHGQRYFLEFCLCDEKCNHEIKDIKELKKKIATMTIEYNDN